MPFTALLRLCPTSRPLLRRCRVLLALGLAALGAAGCATPLVSNIQEVTPALAPLPGARLTFIATDERPYVTARRQPSSYSGVISTYGMKAHLPTPGGMALAGMMAMLLAEGAEEAGAQADVLFVLKNADLIVVRPGSREPTPDAELRKLNRRTEKIGLMNTPPLSLLQAQARATGHTVCWITLHDWRWEFLSFKEPNFFLHHDLDLTVISPGGELLARRAFRGQLEKTYPNSANANHLQTLELKLMWDAILADPALQRALAGQRDPTPYAPLSPEARRARYGTMQRFGLVTDRMIQELPSD